MAQMDWVDDLREEVKSYGGVYVRNGNQCQIYRVGREEVRLTTRPVGDRHVQQNIIHTVRKILRRSGVPQTKAAAPGMKPSEVDQMQPLGQESAESHDGAAAFIISKEEPVPTSPVTPTPVTPSEPEPNGQPEARQRAHYFKRPAIGTDIIVATSGRWGRGTIFGHCQVGAKGGSNGAPLLKEALEPFMIVVSDWQEGFPPEFTQRPEPEIDEAEIARIAAEAARAAVAAARRGRR